MDMNISDYQEMEVGREEFDPCKTPYGVDAKMFPRNGPAEAQFTFLVRYATLAPSTHNTQPWKFSVTEHGIEVYADYSRRLPAADPNGRELLISMGAAIFNLRVAAAHFGLACRVDYNHSGSSEQPLAYVGLTPAPPGGHPDSVQGVLFPAIVRRYTNRSPFLVSRIPASVLARLREFRESGQVVITISVDGRMNQRIADLVGEADRLQHSDQSYRRDIAEWIRSGWTSRPDGLPGHVLGSGVLGSAIGPWATRVLDLGRIRAARDKNLCIDAPGLVVVSSEDSVPDWLAAGEALERLLLTITLDGLQCSYFNMPIQVPALRVQLRAMLGLASWPQVLLRIGYSLAEPVHTPRRPLDEVLVRRTAAH